MKYENAVYAYREDLDADAARLRLKGDRGPASLRGHIYNEHFTPAALGWLGVPKYDIDLASIMDISLQRVVDKGITRLESGWNWDWKNETKLRPPLSTVIDRLGLPWGEDYCKRMIVKSLRYIEIVRTAEVDWNRVHQIYPAAAGISLDLYKDWYDPGYALLSS